MARDVAEPANEIGPESRREEHRLRNFLFLLIMVFCAICFGILAFLAAPKGHERLFSMHVFLELAVAFVSFAMIAIIVNWLRARQDDPLGVEQVYPKWLRRIPHGRIRSQFVQSDKVEVLGVSLYNSLIHDSHFETDLIKRLKDTTKRTRFLLLQEDGDEINRRNAEPRSSEGPSILDRNKSSHIAVKSALQKSRNGHSRDVLRSFDYSPPVTFMRFDKEAYVVFLSNRGGYSPAARVRSGSLLYKNYEELFDFIWNRSDPNEHINNEVKSDQ